MNKHYSEYLKNFSIVIASLPNREHCVCEIYYNNVQWVEISKEADEPIIQFYANPYQPLGISFRHITRNFAASKDKVS